MLQDGFDSNLQLVDIMLNITSMIVAVVAIRDRRELIEFDVKIKPILIAIAIYLVWILATYLLEGRINLLHKADPTGRFIYVITANIIIGTFVAIWLVKGSIIKAGFVTIKQSGFQPIKRTLVVVAIAGVVGYFLFFIQHPASFDPIVLFNVLVQTLPTSIAEVVICWVVIGTAFKPIFTQYKGERVREGRRRKKNSISHYRSRSSQWTF